MTANALLEPDALVIAAHRVNEEHDECDVEHESDQHEHVGDDRRAVDHDVHQHLEHRGGDRDRVAPPLLVRDSVPARGQAGHDEQREEESDASEPEDQPEHGHQVTEQDARLKRLRLRRVEEAALGHGSIVADAATGPGRGSVRARSWPHAASMSTPRLRRTLTCTPCSCSRAANVRMRSPDAAAPPNPLVGLSGMRFTWAPPRKPRRRSPSASAWCGWSLVPAMQAYSNVTRRPFAAAYSRAASSTGAMG